jgi:Flp pilus assembly protein TadG
VEFALLIPIFFSLVMGTFSGAIAYNNKASITQAAREGARYGATVPIDQCDSGGSCSGLTWAQLVQSLTVDRSSGSATTGQVCVALVSGTGATQAAIDSNHTTAGGTAPCWIDNAPDGGNRVQVRITTPADINFVVGDFTVTLVATSVSHYEQ